MIGKRGESPACPFYTGEITMEINFIFQMNSFHRFKRENPLSAHAQALWVELFGLFNARRFPEEMPVSTTHLCAILGLSKDTVLRARRELAENNLISVERGASGRAASVVKMVYFKKDCGQICGEPVEKSVENGGKPGNTPPNSANTDANCDATKAGNFAAQESTQGATHEKPCGANIDANSDPYTNPNGADVNPNAYNPIPGSYPSYPQKEDGCDGKKQVVSLRQARKRAIDQLGLRGELLDEDTAEDQMLAGIVELMAQVYARTGGSITISGVPLSVETVQDVFAKLTLGHVRYVMDSLKNISTPILNPRSYLLTSLYNAPCTMEYAQQAEYELYKRGRINGGNEKDLHLRRTPEERRAGYGAAVINFENFEDEK